jgi:rhomboid protease GluP
MIAWGISPHRTATIPLGDYNADHYLTLLYQSFINLNWRIGYFDHDGIIAYTNISWPSYSEEVSIRVYSNHIIIKSECVGYQGFFTDYGKNQQNLDLLFTEIEYAEFHLQNNLEQTTHELIHTIPEKQFINLSDPPMVGKEKLRGFLSVFTPQKNYAVTPILVLINIAVFIVSAVAMGFMIVFLAKYRKNIPSNFPVDLFLPIGFNSRTLVLHGQVWRLLSNIFLHFSIGHLLGNMIVLIYIGSLIESKLGKWNFLFLYLFTGLIASMVSVMGHVQLIGGGASGAIFGLFGILLALLTTNFYERSARRALLISTAIFVGYNILPSANRHIDYAAHLGGLGSGYVLGLIAYVGLSNPNPAFKKWGIAITCFIVTALFIAGSIFYTPDYQFKQYILLNGRTEDLFNDLRNDYSGNDSATPKDRLDIYKLKTLPQISQLYKAAAGYEKIILPAKQKEIALLQAQIIRLQCHYYKLMYKEIADNDKEKYEDDIDRDSRKIEDLRYEKSYLEGELVAGN